MINEYTTIERAQTPSEIVEARAKEARDAFQKMHPHYTPPPWADLEAWERWCDANTALHGFEGFAARFPEHMKAIERVHVLGGEAVRLRLRALSYGHAWPCTCETINSAFSTNPNGHDTGCPRWGTDMPNRHLPGVSGFACAHDWKFIAAFGEDAPGKSRDTISHCRVCGAVKHEYAHGGGQTSPNYPVIHHVG